MTQPDDKLTSAELPLTEFLWRHGRSQHRTVYARTGGSDWEADTLIGIMDTAELATEACNAHNEALAYHWEEANG